MFGGNSLVTAHQQSEDANPQTFGFGSGAAPQPTLFGSTPAAQSTLFGSASQTGGGSFGTFGSTAQPSFGCSTFGSTTSVAPKTTLFSTTKPSFQCSTTPRFQECFKLIWKIENYRTIFNDRADEFEFDDKFGTKFQLQVNKTQVGMWISKDRQIFSLNLSLFVDHNVRCSVVNRNHEVIRECKRSSNSRFCLSTDADNMFTYCDPAESTLFLCVERQNDGPEGKTIISPQNFMISETTFYSADHPLNRLFREFTCKLDDFMSQWSWQSIRTLNLINCPSLWAVGIRVTERWDCKRLILTNGPTDLQGEYESKIVFLMKASVGVPASASFNVGSGAIIRSPHQAPKIRSTFMFPDPFKVADLFESEKFSDVKICVRGTELPAHRFVLAASSKFWRKCLDEETKTMTVLTVDDYDIETMRELLKFIYTRQPTVVATTELMSAAESFGIDELKRACETVWINELRVGNVDEMLVLSNRFNCTMLGERTIAFIGVNIVEIKRTDALKTIFEEHPDIAYAVFKQIDTKPKQSVFNYFGGANNSFF